MNSKMKTKNKPASFVQPFSEKFPPGSKLVIEGTPFADNLVRFDVDFECGEARDIALHLNPRFNPREFVANSYDYRRGWGVEHRNGMMLLEPGVRFKMEVECDDGGFKVILNGLPMGYFRHRFPPETITHVQIHRDVILSEVTYTPPSVSVNEMPMTVLEHRLAPEEITDLRIAGDVIITEIIYLLSKESEVTQVNKGPFGVSPRWGEDEESDQDLLLSDWEAADDEQYDRQAFSYENLQWTPVAKKSLNED